MINYIPGLKNGKADALSRHDQLENENQVTESVLLILVSKVFCAHFVALINVDLFLVKVCTKSQSLDEELVKRTKK